MDFNSPDTALDKGEVSSAAAQLVDLKATHLPAVILSSHSLIIIFFSRYLLINF